VTIDDDVNIGSRQDTHLDVAQHDATTVCASTVNCGGVTLSVCDWTAHDESRSRVIRGIALGADLLVRRSKKNWGLNHVLCIATKT